VRHVDDAAHERRLLAILVDARHEGAIDLEDVEREQSQVTQGRIAGAEVVDGQADTDVLELAQLVLHPFVVLDEQSLGDLERELFGRDPRRLQRAAHV
jgi:hypothetical protein